MTAQTVPRPPAATRPTTEDPTAAVIDWQAVWIVILTAIPMTVAWVSGFVIRCVSIVWAASVEAYLVGRRGTASDEDADPATVPTNPPGAGAVAVIRVAKEANRR